ncbi:AAA family ATPase [Catalinimonas niigatensis]|uniref:AAA family ATPase n=1 Tax=Catalinimonas niigatensis TaxID=1397264 RepID=UPI0026654572|nr:AAA family ATPase [Catalinimonas niigatensis]WPP48671.1 AAA family ATPase [Catalinimonas niigatensis]
MEHVLKEGAPTSDHTNTSSFSPPIIQQEYSSLYGRTSELQAIVQALRHPPREDANLLFVSGPAGIGKTSLIHRALSETGGERVFVLRAKGSTSILRKPYAVLRRSFTHWVNQLLYLSDEELQLLRTNIQQAVGKQGYILSEILEELEWLVGHRNSEGNSLASHDGNQARQQFAYFFHKLLRAITESGYKLIFFWDDWQWVDATTLNLLLDLLKLYELPNVQIIGAYRTELYEDVKPYLSKLQTFHTIHHWEISPLKAQDLQFLIPAEWTIAESEQAAFMEYFYQASAGNPFAAQEIISWIQKEGMIVFEPHVQLKLKWNKLPRIQKNQDAIRLIIYRLNHLSAVCKQIAGTGAILGFSFTENSLRKLLDNSTTDITEGLAQLQKEKVLHSDEKECFFIHDNVFTAAESLLSDLEKQQIHHRYALSLNQEVQWSGRHPQFLDMLNHLNLALPLLSSAEQDALWYANWIGARVYRKKMAFDKAKQYFAYCLTHKPSINQEHKMQRLYAQLPMVAELKSLQQWRLQILLEIAECELLLQDFMSALARTEEVLSQTQDLLMRLQAYTLSLKICVAWSNLKNAPAYLEKGMQITEEVLQQYGIDIPKADFDQYMYKLCLRIKKRIFKEGIEAIRQRPINEDKAYQTMMHFIVQALPLVFFVHIQKSKCIALASLYLCMKKGYTPVTPALFASSVWAMSAQKNGIAIAIQLGNIALYMVQREPYQRMRHAIFHLATLNFYNWQHHYQESIRRLDESTQFSLEQGDLNYAVFCMTNARLFEIYLGTPLLRHAYATPTLRQQHVHFVNRSHTAFVQYMSGKKPGFAEGKFTFSHSLIEEAKYNTNCRFHFSLVKEKLYFMTEQYDKALRNAQICEQVYQLYEAFQIGMEHDFYYALLLIEMAYRRQNAPEDWQQRVKDKLKIFAHLATYRSGNYQHKVWLIKAGIAKCQGKKSQAIAWYDKAQEEAEKQNFTSVAALASELAGHYLYSLGKKRKAYRYLQEALHYYEVWQAEGKKQWLLKRYPDLLHSLSVYEASLLPEKTTAYEDIRQLSQSLQLSDLVKALLQISVHRTKAGRGVFLLRQTVGWKVLADFEQEGWSIPATSLAQYLNQLPRHFVYEMLKQPQASMVDSTQTSSPSPDQSYFNLNHIKTAVGIPIIYQQEAIAYVYLEGVPEPASVLNNPMLQLIFAQAGVSLSHAGMYENLQQLNMELKQQQQRRVEAMMEAQEKERKRIAEELHDHLGQMLSLVKLNFSQIEDHITGKYELFENSNQLLDESCQEIRRIAYNLMPPDIQHKSLVEVLEILLRRQAIASALDIRFTHASVPEDLSELIMLNVYRIVQELVHNVIKHAQASQMTLDIEGATNGLVLTLGDDGKGFEIEIITSGLGLRNIHSRVHLLKGKIEVHSAPNEGTSYYIYIPLET